MNYYLALYPDFRVEGVYSNTEDRKDLKIINVSEETARLAASTSSFSDFTWENNSLIFKKIEVSRPVSATIVVDEL